MKTDIIAEIGWNHLGKRELIHDMIKAAAESGADYVKFQSWQVDKLCPGPWDNDGRREIYEAAEIDYNDHAIIKSLCCEYKVKFMSSFFDVETLEKHHHFVDAIKVASMEITNHELLYYIVRNLSDKKVYVSTGAATMEELKKAYTILCPIKDLIFMHCVSTYPAKPEDLNMKKMTSLDLMLRKHLRDFIPVGYSGHGVGINDAMIAIIKGAVAVEKHFTTDKELPGRDNKFALNPSELKQLVEFRDYYHKSMSRKDFGYLPEEEEIRDLYRGRFSGNFKVIKD